MEKYELTQTGQQVQQALNNAEKVPTSLYNLGYFDSDAYTDANGIRKIDRKTGYGYFTGGETWELYSNTFWYCTIKIPDGSLVVLSNGVIARVNNENQIRVYLSDNPNITTSTNMNLLFPYGTQYQYELAEAYQYTEPLLEGCSLNTLDGAGSAWLRSEYDKTLNLFNDYSVRASSNVSYSKVTNSSLTFTVSSANRPFIYFTVKGVKTNTIYTISINRPTNFAFLEVNSVRETIGNKITFNSSNSTTFDFGLEFASNVAQTVTINIMLNEGSVAYTYQEPHGEIVHKRDIEPALLWTNQNPSSSFSGQTISKSIISNFKYLIFEYKYYSQWTCFQTAKIRFIYTSGANNSFSLWGVNNAEPEVASRRVTPTSDHSFEIGNAYMNNSANNDFIIPINIYGTNNL